jgi:hypothetical protein
MDYQNYSLIEHIISEAFFLLCDTSINNLYYLHCKFVNLDPRRLNDLCINNNRFRCNLDFYNQNYGLYVITLKENKMRELIWAVSPHTYRGTEEELLSEPFFKNQQLIQQKFIEDGFIYIRVKEGDYEGSIAKFTTNNSEKEKKLFVLTRSRERSYNINFYFYGNLSWDKKRNNPKFILYQNNAEILLGYRGETVLKRVDFKKQAKKLRELELYDINDKVLALGDSVLYINTRYGGGTCLSKGVIVEFKPHVRGNYLSVIITNSEVEDQTSELNYPSMQIYKLGG